MPAVMRDDADDFVPQFLGKSLLFLQGKPGDAVGQTVGVAQAGKEGGQLRDMAFP